MLSRRSCSWLTLIRSQDQGHRLVYSHGAVDAMEDVSASALSMGRDVSSMALGIGQAFSAHLGGTSVNCRPLRGQPAGACGRAPRPDRG